MGGGERDDGTGCITLVGFPFEQRDTPLACALSRLFLQHHLPQTWKISFQDRNSGGNIIGQRRSNFTQNIMRIRRRNLCATIPVKAQKIFERNGRVADYRNILLMLRDAPGL